MKNSKKVLLTVSILMAMVLGWTSTSQAVQYNFLSVAGNGIGGNFASSTFTSGNGKVQGHLAMSMYNDSTTVTFDLTSYTGNLPTLVFGIWNTTDEVTLPAYNVKLLDASNTLVPPTTFNLIGNQDNQTQVAGRHMMQLNTAN